MFRHINTKVSNQHSPCGISKSLIRQHCSSAHCTGTHLPFCLYAHSKTKFHGDKQGTNNNKDIWKGTMEWDFFSTHVTPHNKSSSVIALELMMQMDQVQLLPPHAPRQTWRLISHEVLNLSYYHTDVPSNWNTVVFMETCITWHHLSGTK